MDWNNLWNEKMSKITYAGVRLTACGNCGDFDWKCCDCYKQVWIERRKKNYYLTRIICANKIRDIGKELIMQIDPV